MICLEAGNVAVVSPKNRRMHRMKHGEHFPLTLWEASDVNCLADRKTWHTACGEMHEELEMKARLNLKQCFIHLLSIGYHPSLSPNLQPICNNLICPHLMCLA